MFRRVGDEVTVEAAEPRRPPGERRYSGRDDHAMRVHRLAIVQGEQKSLPGSRDPGHVPCVYVRDSSLLEPAPVGDEILEQ